MEPAPQPRGERASPPNSVDATGRYLAFNSSSRTLSYEFFTGEDIYGGNEQHVNVRDRINRRTWIVSKERRTPEGGGP